MANPFLRRFPPAEQEKVDPFAAQRPLINRQHYLRQGWNLLVIPTRGRMAKQPQVVLLIESSRGYGRGLLRGIAEYIRAHGPWSVYLQRHDLYDAVPPWLRKWRGDGIIARIENEKTARAIRDLGVPAIDLRGRMLDPAMPSILTDDEAGARM